MSWLETAPLAVVGLLVLALLIFAVELGYRGRRWIPGARAPEGKTDDGQGHLLSAALGLLALLLGFTFSMSLNRYEARRELVTQEANAIGTTWLRAQLLEEPNKAAMSQLLRDYVQARLAWSRAPAAPGGLAATEALQGKLWAVTGVALRTDPSAQLTRGLMDAMNESFDTAAARANERAAHIPARVLTVLLIYAALSAALLGYILAASGRPHRVASFLTMTLLSLALVTIIDLDQPRSGAIQVSQQPMKDLQASLAAPP